MKITGVAYAEVDPADRRNAVIVDMACPDAARFGQPGKTPSGKVAYLLNFYILKPVNLNQVDPNLNGYGKVMYEPPNRGGKTWTALGRVSGGGNDPATITDPTILANSFLMPRGLHAGLERVGAIGASCQPGHQPDPRPLPCRSPRTQTAQRSRVLHTSTSALGQLVHLSFPPATLDKTTAN